MAAASGARDFGTRRAFLALGVSAALAPIVGAGCGGTSSNEQEILQGPRGSPSTVPDEGDSPAEDTPPSTKKRASQE